MFSVSNKRKSAESGGIILSILSYLRIATAGAIVAVAAKGVFVPQYGEHFDGKVAIFGALLTLLLILAADRRHSH